MLNLVGLGVGPLFVGMVSDALHPISGAASLRYALDALAPFFLASAAFYQRRRRRAASAAFANAGGT